MLISTVLSGLSGARKTKRSVRSRRASSPGNLRLAALKWLDIVAPFGSGIGPSTALDPEYGRDPIGRHRTPRTNPGRHHRPGFAAARLMGPSFVSCGPKSGHELQQRAVHLFGVGPGNAVRRVREHHQAAALDGLMQALARRRERQVAVSI